MPKKRQNPALLTKPTSSAPSTVRSTVSSSASASNGHGAASSPSVNDLIRESRRANGRRSVEAAASASLHPALRAVLDMPAPPPPRQRTHLHGPSRLRRIPGPRPPQSWLSDSQHAPESPRNIFYQLRWQRARVQQQSSTLPGDPLPKHDSLEHLILKKIATDWVWHAEYDNTYLSTLPVSTRTRLLSYLAVYNEAVHVPNPFPLLFPSDLEKNELDTVRRLDLANSLGSWATVKKVEKELLITKDLPKHKTPVAQHIVENDVPESWDDEPSTALPGTIQVTTASLSICHLRFASLKHLSLAVNSASTWAAPSWSSLVSLTSHLSGLTSLSLANWPTPTYTPNAAKGRVRVVSTAGPSVPDQAFGGTDMYTAFDNNWREAAGIVKSLSRNLYCLTWLDLTGCGPWLPALTWADADGDIVAADWNGAWRNLTTLIVAVGWLPGRPPLFEDGLSSTTRSSSSIDSTRAIEQLYGNSEHIQQSLSRLAELRLSPNRSTAAQGLTIAADAGSDPPWNVEHEREKQYFRRDVERYLNQQNTAKKIAQEIRMVRRQGNGRYIEFVFGQVLGEDYTII